VIAAPALVLTCTELSVATFFAASIFTPIQAAFRSTAMDLTRAYVLGGAGIAISVAVILFVLSSAL
jgi:hypothetical protein